MYLILFIAEKRLDNKPYSFDTTAGLGNFFHNVRLFDVEKEDVLRENRETEYDEGSGISPPKPGASEEAVESTVRAVRKLTAVFFCHTSLNMLNIQYCY